MSIFFLSIYFTFVCVCTMLFILFYDRTTNFRHLVVRWHGNISRIAHIRLCETVKKYAKSVYGVSNTDGSGRGYLEARHLKRT